MKKTIGTLLVMCLCLLVSAVSSRQAFAVSPVPQGQTASLTVHYQQDGKALRGTQFAIYRVADMAERTAFTAAGDFAGFHGRLNGLKSAGEWDGLAQSLADYAGDIRPLHNGEIGKDGTCTFAALPAGLYLVTGSDIRMGNVTYSCKPFVVCLPQYDEETGAWDNNVDASPKAGTPHEWPTPPDHPHDPLLPQTGQLRWPIPVAVCLGIASVSAGMIQRRKKEG